MTNLTVFECNHICNKKNFLQKNFNIFSAIVKIKHYDKTKLNIPILRSGTSVNMNFFIWCIGWNKKFHSSYFDEELSQRIVQCHSLRIIISSSLKLSKIRENLKSGIHIKICYNIKCLHTKTHFVVQYIELGITFIRTFELSMLN